MQDVIISKEKILDSIVLEGEYEYSAYITIGLNKTTDFYVSLVFTNLNEVSFKKLAELSQLSQALKIESSVIKKENYNISHIVVTRFVANNKLSMTWECLSDNPNFSLEIEKDWH
jgi:hypothetical protein